ncbi:MAG: bifunctional (p)ppGpp synthetase/guanosine-3',5'-bis(diphosphate) 3'-pyrophosphohydrolase [Gammaproteobacteria bacterium]|nr:bifunctional (p)ppGpp synthetase/guanosine-3',5'-bis(diphosphate) 3'-pyrophosphohydrolase [Gammaproteobacteria bacterium]
MATSTATIARNAVQKLPAQLAPAIEAYADRLDVGRIERAYRVAAEAHAGQRRASGARYVTHAVGVATILAELRLDTASIAAGLIHDVVEDTAVDLTDVEAQFGPEVAGIVDGVTKIGRVRFRSNAERQVENYRKLLVSMVQDARVILIKLADRLHNMRTLEHLRPPKQRRIALETRNIYAPIAHRLGLAAIKWELEDLAFKFLEPDEYNRLKKKIQQRRRERERQIMQMRRPLVDMLTEVGIPFVDVTGRPKHLWSIHKKIRANDLPFEEIQDLLALRVITDSVQHCYASLGVIHNRWTPVQERFRDYIATPKSNMYQSLHTTVFGPRGRRYEIQIRTEAMHLTAEQGIAAHWRYKEGGDARKDEVGEALSWFRQVLEWQKDTSEPEEFMEFLRMDLFQGEIFVFTPKGEVKQLPVGATPIDFAYSVHSEIGSHCAGARVNGRIAPLSRKLKNGDTVEIIKNAKQRPNRDWLAFVKTSRARGQIRRCIRKEEFASALQLGGDFLKQELRKRRLPKPDDDAKIHAAAQLGYPDFDQMQAALGRGDVGPAAALKALFPDQETTPGAQRPSTLRRIAARIRPSSKGVRIQGVDNLMVRYSQCCQPVPGDDVIGYITVGRGISIHRSDCANVLYLSQDPERRVEIRWTAEKGDTRMVKIQARAVDRRGLLSDIAKAIANTGTNIQNADVRSDRAGMSGEFVVEVEDLSHLEKVLKAVNQVKGVLTVERREGRGETGRIEA